MSRVGSRQGRGAAPTMLAAPTAAAPAMKLRRFWMICMGKRHGQLLGLQLALELLEEAPVGPLGDDPVGRR